MQSHASTAEIPEELRERAAKMVFEVRERDGKGHGEIARVAAQLGVHREAPRTWIRQAAVSRRDRHKARVKKVP